ncbi:MAG: hypothetical protein ACFFB6_10055 [Promethearchaeota archaeon]
MINKKFKDNWTKILKFNSTRDILEDSEKNKAYVRLPLSPITINANLLYQFFELLYPKFINDQQNILDVIISDIDKKNEILGLYLYKTKKAGIYETIETLPDNLIRIKSIEFEKLDEIFNNVQNAIIKEKNIRISSIHIFRKEAIDLINKHCEKIEEISIHEFLERSMDLIEKIINQDLVLIYPEPIIIKFFRNSITLLNKIHLKSLFTFIERVIPEFNLSLLIDGNGIKLILSLQKKLSKSGKSHLAIRFLTPEELRINLSNSNIKDNLRLIQKKLKTENTYYIKQNDIISFVSDFIELAIPLKKDNVQFLLQKFLFGYRSFENNWNIVPRPRIYNNLVRFTIRLFGFNVNLRKLSHWAIPEVIFNYIDFYIGLNSRILLILTDITKTKNVKFSSKIFFKSTYKFSLLLEFEQSTLKKIISINNEELFSGKYNSLNSIKEKIREKFGSPSAVIVLDEFLLQSIIKNFIFRHTKLAFFPRLKTLKMLKNEMYLTIHPEFPPYRLIKKKKTISLIKLVLPILIDKHEF